MLPTSLSFLLRPSPQSGAGYAGAGRERYVLGKASDGLSVDASAQRVDDAGGGHIGVCPVDAKLASREGARGAGKRGGNLRGCFAAAAAVSRHKLGAA